MKPLHTIAKISQTKDELGKKVSRIVLSNTTVEHNRSVEYEAVKSTSYNILLVYFDATGLILRKLFFAYNSRTQPEAMVAICYDWIDTLLRGFYEYPNPNITIESPAYKWHGKDTVNSKSDELYALLLRQMSIASDSKDFINSVEISKTHQPSYGRSLHRINVELDRSDAFLFRKFHKKVVTEEQEKRLCYFERTLYLDKYVSYNERYSSEIEVMFEYEWVEALCQWFCDRNDIAYNIAPYMSAEEQDDTYDFNEQWAHEKKIQDERVALTAFAGFKPDDYMFIGHSKYPQLVRLIGIDNDEQGAIKTNPVNKNFNPSKVMKALSSGEVVAVWDKAYVQNLITSSNIKDAHALTELLKEDTGYVYHQPPFNPSVLTEGI